MNSCSHKDCRRQAHYVPRLVTWPTDMHPQHRFAENTITLVLDLPVCTVHKLEDPNAYLGPRNRQTFLDYAELQGRRAPDLSSLIVEFVPIGEWEQIKAAAAEGH